MSKTTPAQQNGAFRKKKVYFSQVSNTALRDKNLSLKAKGLYALITSYITLEDFTLYKDYLMSLSTDKKDGFNRVWDELKSHGYLVQYSIRNESGQYVYEYELLDEPRELTQEEREAFEKKEANRIARNKRKLENQKAKNQPQTEIPPTEKTIDGNSTDGVSTTGKTVYISNTDFINTDLNNTDNSSSSSSSSRPKKKEDEEDIIDNDIIQAYKDAFSNRPSKEVQKAISFHLIKQDKDLVLHALSLSALYGAKSFQYTRNILNDYRIKDIYNLDDLSNYELTEQA